jgi:hypothetical protein
VDHAHKIAGFFRDLFAKQHYLLAYKVLNRVLRNRELNNLARFVLNDKIYVKPNASNRVDREEIHGVDAANLHLEEFCPAQGTRNFPSFAKRCKNSANRGFRNLNPDFPEFALDMTGAEKVGIFIFHLQDQVPGLFGYRRSAELTLSGSICPSASDNLFLPTEQSFRFHDADFFLHGREEVQESNKDALSSLRSNRSAIQDSAKDFVFFLQQKNFCHEDPAGFTEKPEYAEDQSTKLMHLGELRFCAGGSSLRSGRF